jgi:hypothetical protein
MVHYLWSMNRRVSSGGSNDLAPVSQVLWGNQDRFLVALAVAEADPGELYAQALADLIPMPDKRVGPQLRKFVELGLLVRLPRVGSERRVYHQRVNEPFWIAVRQMGAALRGS